MAFFFLIIFVTMQMVLHYLMDLFGLELGLLELALCLTALGVLAVLIVSFITFQPLNRVIHFLTLLLNQPKTENIRVTDVEFNAIFKQGEWRELGDLVRKVERKLRRRTKALLRETTELTAVMNSLDTPLIAVTTNMEVSFLNSAFAVSFDLSAHHDSGKSIQVKKIYDLEVDKSFIEVLERAVKEETFEKKMLPLKTDGRQRIFSISMTPLRRRVDNSLYGVVASLNDETQKVELDRQRMDFVANASHELRTPITAISTSVNLLNRIEDEETRKQVMESLGSNSKRLVTLTQELLDLSKLEGEVEQADYDFVNLKTLTHEVLGILSHPEKNLVENQFEVEEGFFDESKVKQVLTNLIRNALIYTPVGTKVSVRWFKEEEHLVLSVKDWGEGIPAEEHPRMFERFYRVDKSRSRKVGGSGIGLSIVKHIMNLHGGEAKLMPYVKGEGADFRCYFPLKG